MGGRLRARPTSKGGFAVQGRLPTPPLDRERDRDWSVTGLPVALSDAGTDPVGGGSVGAGSVGAGAVGAAVASVLSSSITPSVLPLSPAVTPPAATVPGPVETELRDTKVSTREETKDGSAVEGARAH
jgi:hypothetical protein